MVIHNIVPSFINALIFPKHILCIRIANHHACHNECRSSICGCQSCHNFWWTVTLMSIRNEWYHSFKISEYLWNSYLCCHWRVYGSNVHQQMCHPISLIGHWQCLRVILSAGGWMVIDTAAVQRATRAAPFIYHLSIDYQCALDIHRNAAAFPSLGNGGCMAPNKWRTLLSFTDFSTLLR